jgi:hypothetical protein
VAGLLPKGIDMGALSKLDAVNRILRAAGEYPVSTLAVTGSNDVTIAEQTLDEVTIQAQLAGLNCNTIEKQVLPDSQGKVYIPDDTLSVDTAGNDSHRNIVQRGRTPTYLFDIDNNTDVFEIGQLINIKIVNNLSFESLPTAEQFEITDQAARMYQMATVGETNQDKLLQEIAFMSRAKSRAANMRSLDGSFINNTKSSWPSITARRNQGP